MSKNESLAPPRPLFEEKNYIVHYKSLFLLRFKLSIYINWAKNLCRFRIFGQNNDWSTRKRLKKSFLRWGQIWQNWIFHVFDFLNHFF